MVGVILAAAGALPLLFLAAKGAGKKPGAGVDHGSFQANLADPSNWQGPPNQPGSTYIGPGAPKSDNGQGIKDTYHDVKDATGKPVTNLPPPAPAIPTGVRPAVDGNGSPVRDGAGNRVWVDAATGIPLTPAQVETYFAKLGGGNVVAEQWDSSAAGIAAENRKAAQAGNAPKATLGGGLVDPTKVKVAAPAGSPSSVATSSSTAPQSGSEPSPRAPVTAAPSPNSHPVFKVLHVLNVSPAPTPPKSPPPTPAPITNANALVHSLQLKK